MKVFNTEYRKLSNQYRFVREIIEGKLVVAKKKKAVIVQELHARKYDPFPKNVDPKKNKSTDEEDEEEVEAEEEAESGGDVSARDYEYLLSVRSLALDILCGGLLTSFADANLGFHHGTPREAEEPDRS